VGEDTFLVATGDHMLTPLPATRALINLIELTATVRCFNQANQGDKAATHLKKALDRYIQWAASDGGYDTLDIIPNIIVEIVDTNMPNEQITKFMRDKMVAVAQRHREHLRVKDQDDDEKDELSLISLPEDVAIPSVERLNMPEVEGKEFGCKKTGSEATHTHKPPRYSRPPPVLYGLFIIKNTVMILTADSAKEAEAFHTSYQVELGFNVKDQGVWNAMTTAIVVCLARDDMVARKGDYKPLVAEPESDPDA
jgi:hypothetical protein